MLALPLLLGLETIENQETIQIGLRAFGFLALRLLLEVAQGSRIDPGDESLT